MILLLGCAILIPLLSAGGITRNIKDDMRLPSNDRTILQRADKILANSHPCRVRMPCKNLGICIPIKDASNQYTEDYYCKCFKEYFKPSNDKYCREEAVHCKEGVCGNGGTCIETWGSFFCKCPPDKGGITCNEKFEAERMDTPTFLFDPDARTGYPHQFIMYTSAAGSKFSFNVTFETNHVMWSNMAWRNDSMLPYVHLFTSPVIQDKIKTAGKSPVLFQTFSFTFSVKYTATRHINISLMNEDMIQYNGSLPLKVNHNATECIPYVHLYDCSIANRKALRFRRGGKYVLRSHVKPGCPELDPELKFTWTIYDVSNLVLPFDTGEFKNRIEYSQPQGKPNEYFILPYSLKIGIYSVRVQVEEIVQGKDLKPHKYPAMRMGFFYMSPELHVAAIEGGSKRQVGNAMPLIMDASPSFDPNNDEMHQNLKFAWSCKPKDGFETPPICKGLDETIHAEKVLTINPKELLPGNEITFQLQVSKPERHELKEDFLVSQEPIKVQQIVVVNSGNPPIITIRCLRNCARNIRVHPQEEVSFEAVCTANCKGSNNSDFYEWKQSEGPTKLEWLKHTQTSTNSHMLIIKRGAMEEGGKYGFIVAAGGDTSKYETSFEIQVNKFPNIGLCDVKPSEGFESDTPFRVDCVGFTREDRTPLIYQIYQLQNPSETGYGHLLEYDVIRVRNVTLSRGLGEDYTSKIIAVITDIYGMNSTVELVVQVKPSEEILEDASAYLNATLSGRENDSIPIFIRAGAASAVTDMVYIVSNMIKEGTFPLAVKLDAKNKLISALKELPIDTFYAVIQVSLALEQVVKTEREIMDYSLARQSLDLAIELSKQLDHTEMNKYFPTEALQNVAGDIFDIVSIVMHAIKKSQGISDAGDDFEEEYTDFALDTIARVKEMYISTREVWNTIFNNVGVVMMERRVESQEELIIESISYSWWLKIDKPQELSKISMSASNETAYVKILNELASKLNPTPIGVQIVTSPLNPFWWHSSGGQLNSHSLSLMMKNMKNNEKITEFPMPLDLHLKITTERVEKISGTFNIPRKDDGKLIHKDNIPIYSLDMRKGRTVVLIFSTIMDYDIKVLISQNKIPTVEDFNSQGEIIPTDTSKNPRFVRTKETAVDDDALFYIALIPVNVGITRLYSNRTVRQATKRQNFTMKYSFKIFAPTCQYWDEQKRILSHEGCQVGKETTTQKLHCRCTHSSIFTGSTSVPPSTLMTFRNITFSLRFQKNPNMLIFILVLLLLSLLLLIWARFIDKRDRVKRNIVILADNYQSDSYAYLITVYTGFRRYAGTTSKVGIRLKGTNDVSKPHLLISKTKPTFTTGARDWFVIFTAGNLGEINEIHLWHNSTGHRPDWYCNIVVVRDIQTKQRWVFLVNKWVSLIRDNCIAQYYLNAATEKQLKSRQIMFRQNIVYNNQENHIWLSPFKRNPRSFFTRCQRVGVLLCGIHFAMLFNMFFFEVTRDPVAQIDPENFHFSGHDTLNVFLSALTTIPVNFILMFLFRKAYHPKESKRGHIQRRKISDSTNIYSDVENERRFTIIRKIIFYCLPTDPLSRCHELIKARILSRSSDAPIMIPKSEEGKPYFPFRLHSLVKYMAWFICAVIIIFVSVVVSLIGFYIDTMMSYQWMVSIIMIMFVSALIIEPVKLLIIVLFSTFYMKVHPFDVDFLRGHPLGLIIEVPYTDEEMALIRTKPEYRPLSEQQATKVRRRVRARIRMQDMAIDLFVFTIYLILLFWIASSTVNHHGFRSTESVRKMFVDSIYYGIPLRKVRDNATLIDYLNNTLIPSIHETRHMEARPMKGSSWTVDNNCQLIGVARLRQHRVRPDNICPRTSPIAEGMLCSPEYSSSTTDTSDYHVGWKTEPEEVQAYRQKARQPWLYQNSWETGSYSLMGESTSYPGGGYVADLGRTRKNSRAVLTFLVGSDWFNGYTRLIAVEFTLYNANVRLFNVITILMEINPTGFIETSYKIHTSELIYEFGTHIDLLLAFICFFMINCFFVYQQIVSIQRNSFKNHFSHIWGFADLFRCTLAFTCIGLYFLRAKYSSSLVHALETSAPDTFIHFYEASAVDGLLKYLLAFLVFTATLRFWRILGFFHYFYVFKLTLIKAAKSILGLMFIVFICVGALSGIVYLVMGSQLKLFLSPLRSLVTLLSITTGFHSAVDYGTLAAVDRIIGPAFYLVLCTVSIIYVANMFIAVIMEYYAVAKESEKERDTYSLYDCLRDEFNYHCRRKPGPEIWEQERRLRGGGDDNQDIYSKLSPLRGTKAFSNLCQSQLNSNIREKFSKLLQQAGYIQTNFQGDSMPRLSYKQNVNDMCLEYKINQSHAHSLNHKTDFCQQNRKNGIFDLKNMFKSSISHDSKNSVSTYKSTINSDGNKLVSNQFPKINKKQDWKSPHTPKKTYFNHEQEIEILKEQLNTLSEQLSKMIQIMILKKEKLIKLKKKK